MALENKSGITDSSELARVEEKISKKKALEMFELLDTFEVGTFKALSEIHKCLFGEIYDFAGKMRDETLQRAVFVSHPLCTLKLHLIISQNAAINL